MKIFKNKITGEELGFVRFVFFILDEAERQFEDNNDELWCNLTKLEQVECACEQWEHQLGTNWEEIEN